jgi:hypothetical protein
VSKRKKPEPKAEAQLSRRYEGEDTLASLLKEAGSSLSVDEVCALMHDAQAEAVGADELFPELFFDDEPHFSSPEAAQRLYANLFGLWDRIAGKSRTATPKHEPATAPEPVEGPLTDEFVEAAWRHLADLPLRESERWLHRWENTQPELTEALREQCADDGAVFENVDTLGFELWAMLDLAQPKKRLRPVLLDELQAALDASDAPEPALDGYIDEAIEEAKLADPPLSDEQAQKVARLARAVVRALCKVR